MKKIWTKLKATIKWLFSQLKDWRNWIIFIIVAIVVGCEVWIPALIGIITGNAWFYAIAAICWAFWLAPFTPFIPLCIGITFAVRKLIDKLNKK